MSDKIIYVNPENYYHLEQVQAEPQAALALTGTVSIASTGLVILSGVATKVLTGSILLTLPFVPAYLGCSLGAAYLYEKENVTFKDYIYANVGPFGSEQALDSYRFAYDYVHDYIVGSVVDQVIDHP
jgi:hypothetical protein